MAASGTSPPLLELVENEQLDVELANRARAPRVSRRTERASLLGLGARCDEWEARRATVASRRAPGGSDVASPALAAGSARPEGRDSLADEVFRSRSAHIATSSVLSTIDRVRRTLRIAAIDIGTNSVHMIVVRCALTFSFEVIDREKAMVRLGAGGLDGAALTSEAMTAALQALSSSSGSPNRIAWTRFSRPRRARRARRATAASSSRASSARRASGPRVISGVEEARLIHQAAVYGVRRRRRPRRGDRHRRRQRRDHARHGDDDAAGAQLQDRVRFA